MHDILFPSSHWGSNIGNAFFHLGTLQLLTEAWPNARVHQTDLFAEKAFEQKKWHKSNDVRYTQFVEGAQAIVLDGPMFDKSFRYLFEPILRPAKEKGIKILLMSTGGIEYDREEIEHCRAVLSEFPPDILTTRDADTFENYGDLAGKAYNGICSAWFVADAYPGYDTPALGAYIALPFDSIPEPIIELSGFEKEDQTSYQMVNVGAVTHGSIQKVFRLGQRRLPLTNGKYRIIRPSHQVLHRANWRLFFKPSSFVSQTPFAYLNIYRNAALTITDRVHACVATLAYGNPARLLTNTKRSKLLEQAGAVEVERKIIRLNMPELEAKKNSYRHWLRVACSDLYND